MAATLSLLVVGTVTIYSVGHPAEPGTTSQTKDFQDLANNWQKQIIFIAIGAAAFIAVNLVNYRRLGAASYWIYGVVLLLLAVVLLGRFVNLPFVPLINGTHRWIKIHPSLPSIQPSELCKLAYILALAWYLRYRSNYRSFKALIGPFILTIVPMVLILLEPDLGTVMLMMPILFTMLFVAGAKVRHLLIIILLAFLVC